MVTGKSRYLNASPGQDFTGSQTLNLPYIILVQFYTQRLHRQDRFVGDLSCKGRGTNLF